MDRANPPRLAGRLRGAGALAVGTGVANVLGYVLTVTAARSLGPEQFGAFGALLALVLVGNVAALAVQAATARTVATGSDPAPAVRSSLVMAVVVGGALVVASPVLRSLLRLDSLLPVVAAAVAITALTLAAPALGYVQGRERFRALAVLVAGQSVLRVGGGVAAMAATTSAGAAMAGIAAGLVVAVVLAWVVARPPWPAGPWRPLRPAMREILTSALLLLGFVVLTNVDVMLARHVLAEHDSGLYAAGAIFTKIAFWLPQFVPLLAFPALADPQRRRGAMTRGLLVVGTCGALLVGAVALGARPAVRLVAGGDYAAVAPQVAAFVALGALYAVANLLVYAHLAHGERWSVVVVWTVLAGYVAVVESTATTVTGVLVPGLGAAALIVVWGLLREAASAGRAGRRLG